MPCNKKIDTPSKQLKISNTTLEEEEEKTFLQERLPSGDKVIHENHDQEKKNMNMILETLILGLRTTTFQRSISGIFMARI